MKGPNSAAQTPLQAKHNMTRVQGLACIGCALWLSAFYKPAQADCADVSVMVSSGVALGTVRASHNASGFIELHPTAGLSITASGVAHSGPIGPGAFRVIGPPGHTMQINLQLIDAAEDEASTLRLSEILVQNGAELTRLPPEGGVLEVTLPSHANGHDSGRAQRQISVGAVIRFRWRDRAELGSYRLMVECSHGAN